MGRIVALRANPQQTTTTITALVDRARVITNEIYAAQEKVKRAMLVQAGHDSDDLFIALYEVQHGGSHQRRLVRAGWHAANLATTCRLGAQRTQNLGLRDRLRSWATQAYEISLALETADLDAEVEG